MLSAVYYLWAAENLPRNWEQNPSLSVASPKARAQPAAHPAIKLIVDPSNATWVKNYWGADYPSPRKHFLPAAADCGTHELRNNIWRKRLSSTPHRSGKHANGRARSLTFWVTRRLFRTVLPDRRASCDCGLSASTSDTRARSYRIRPTFAPRLHRHSFGPQDSTSPATASPRARGSPQTKSEAWE
jgi:hypothetical protein